VKLNPLQLNPRKTKMLLKRKEKKNSGCIVEDIGMGIL
jgi:hypothetical protein